MPGCTVGIVNYNTRDLLRTCIDAVLPQSPAEIIVVDNGSTDGSAEMVRGQYPQIRLLPEKNLGFGGGANRLLEFCRTEYLLLLNSDAFLYPGAIDELVQDLEAHPRAAVAAPELFSCDGTAQRSWRRFPGTFAWFFDNSVSRKLFPFRGDNESRSRAVPWVFGAVFAARTAALREAGGFDTGFFMYCEDIDLCYRLWRAGWEVRYTSAASALHVGGASTGQVRAEMAERLIQSTVRFYRKHYSGLRARALVTLLRATLAFRWIRDSVLSWMVREDSDRRRLARNALIWRAGMKLPVRSGQATNSPML